MKKKSLFLMLAASLVLTACGGTDRTENVKTPETEISVSADYDADKKEEDSVTKTDEPVKEEVSISQEDEKTSESAEEFVALRDAVEENTGFFVGCAATGDELKDDKVWDIITTHFNRITFGNELKPDALVDYSVAKCNGTKEDELNGETIVVPKLSFVRAERMLDKVYDWNKEHPDREIKVRGHVLVWHSQTPEWFFHENYDKTQPYVDKETMNKRLEWYIREVLTHFTGEDSKYKGMFYGWDVVNEAVSDGKGGTDGLRTDAENSSESLNEDRHGSNSSWYHIYQNNEFIINAFKYANKYAPADLELYYNDYNECSLMKRNKIVALLEAIKAEEGEPGVGTRIDAMGMQGHYGMESPSANDVEVAIKTYGKVVGKVQITEMDISASSDYDASADSVIEENEKLRKRYKMLYFSIKSAANAANVEFEGLTFWGTVDHYSWLQSRSNIGGGNKTGLPQMPLLFDQNYEPKPCFYVFTK